MFTCPTYLRFPQVLLLVQKQVEAITARLDALSQTPDDADSVITIYHMTRLRQPTLTRQAIRVTNQMWLMRFARPVTNLTQILIIYTEDNAIEVSDAEPRDISIPISEPGILCGQDKRHLPTADSMEWGGMCSCHQETP